MVRRLLFLLAAAGAVAMSASAASAATITIDGHFKESFPKSGPAACFVGEPAG